MIQMNNKINKDNEDKLVDKDVLDELNLFEYESKVQSAESLVNDPKSINYRIDFLRIVWCDNANIIRAKAIHLPSSSHPNYCVGISPAQQAIPVMYDGVVSGTNLSPVGEIQLSSDLSSLTQVPYAPGHARVMGDMMKDGNAWECCPRRFLKSVKEDLSIMGLKAKCAFENEFYLLNNEKIKKPGNDIGKIKPVDNTPFASTFAMDLNHEVVSDIVQCLNLQGMIVEQYYPESGPGQQEITIRYTSPLQSANNQIIFRETVRAVAKKHGIMASFLPKIFPNKAGSGCHIHLSLWKGENNILSDTKNQYGLSETASQFIAGILKHLPGLMAITTPTTNSYRRIQPHSWCGAFQCFGFNNREAAIRVISENNVIRDIEFKVIDASSNPYLALGTVLAAGRQGIKQKLSLTEPIKSDPGHLTRQEREKRGIRPLPSSLGESLSILKKDKVLLKAMGSELSKAYLAVKKAEWEALKDLSFEEEVKLLLDKY